MRCHLPLDDEGPFPDDDPFLPRQDAPSGLCQKCGQTHRLDMGCGPSITGSMHLVVIVVVAVFAAACAGAWIARSLR